jgi:hypothetical protein
MKKLASRAAAAGHEHEPSWRCGNMRARSASSSGGGACSRLT